VAFVAVVSCEKCRLSLKLNGNAARNILQEMITENHKVLIVFVYLNKSVNYKHALVHILLKISAVLNVSH
jgi:hypothetical protein